MQIKQAHVHALVVLMAAAEIAACSTDKKADAAQPVTRREGSVDPRPSVVETPSRPYQQMAVSGGVRLTGTVDFEGPLPPDSIAVIPPEVQGCGRAPSSPSIVRTGTRIGGAVVWLVDIRAGKPLPIERRFELANTECFFSPQVLAVFAPATLNVASEDVAMHRNRIINVATGDLEGIAPFNDNGEVIPFDSLLTKPAQLEVTCDLHPWSKASVLVFDHPYFALTERAGTFSIDDVPPGTYRVKAWHPRLGASEQTVTITAGQPATMAFRLSRAGQPAGSAPDSLPAPPAAAAPRT